MSRIGKKPIILPPQAEIKIEKGKVLIKGPKGQLEQTLPKEVMIESKGSEVLVTVKDEKNKEERALWGLFRSLINNMAEGVVSGFSKQLEINGIGYKAAVQGKELILNVGYSHPVNYSIPKEVDISVEKNLITISGIDKQKIGQVAAEIRAVRKPEPYKGKGIKYIDEVIRRKAGKVVKGAE